jgi:hypothetical protein
VVADVIESSARAGFFFVEEKEWTLRQRERKRGR